MLSPEPKILKSELSDRLQSLMLLRVIFVSLFLGASIFIQVRETQTYYGNIQTFHYLLIAVIYLLTFAYVIILKHTERLLWFAYLQLLLDTFLVTAIVYTTGGIESIFSSIYFLCIIYGSIMLYRRGGMTVASCSSILYGSLLDLHYYGVIHPLGSRLSYPEQYQSSYLFYNILVNITAFYVVAYLSSYLSEQARKSSVELKAKQIDVDKLEMLNESIINSIDSGLIALDDRGKIILFNPAAEEIFGIRAPEAFGRQVETVLPTINEHLAWEKRPPYRGAEKLPRFMDIPFLRADGGKIYLRLSISPLRLLLGEQKGSILIFQDLTEIRQIEEEMKKVEGLAMIGELAAGIAHEIRNPMASISGSIQLLGEGLNQDDVNGRLMDIISREINRLNHLVNDFLLFARPKQASLTEFDLNQLILESLELFRNSQHWSEGITIVSKLHDPVTLESDPEQIKQVLWNLLLNASEAVSGEGSVYVSTGLEPASNENERQRVKIVIRDTGEGFNQDALSQLFTPFFTTKEKGSGLGLAIVKRIVEGLQGEIFGANHEDGGAQISLYLPASL